MSADNNPSKKHKVPCFGHIFKAVFILAWIVMIMNLAHIIIAIRHKDYVHVPAPTISMFCYLCIILAQCFWVHYFFYPEFFLNALALPIKVIMSVWLLFNSIDLLETNIEELLPSTEVSKDVVHSIRAAFVLIGVIFELYVFRLCQKAHHLMKHMPKHQGKRHFSIRKFLSAKDILDHLHHHEPKETAAIDSGKDVEKANSEEKETKFEEPKKMDVADLNLPV